MWSYLSLYLLPRVRSLLSILARLTDRESGDDREVLHYHYTTWPDFGIPQSPHAFLMFLAAVREAGVLEECQGPAVVHCSAGIGRSGTFSLVDSYLLMVSVVFVCLCVYFYVFFRVS